VGEKKGGIPFRDVTEKKGKKERFPSVSEREKKKKRRVFWEKKKWGQRPRPRLGEKGKGSALGSRILRGGKKYKLYRLPQKGNSCFKGGGKDLHSFIGEKKKA